MRDGGDADHRRWLNADEEAKGGVGEGGVRRREKDPSDDVWCTSVCYVGTHSLTHTALSLYLSGEEE